MKLLTGTLKTIVLITCLSGGFYPVRLWADQDEMQEEQSSSVFASIWNAAKLYENKGNPYIRSFSLVGLYHGQYWSADSEENRDEDWENRRFYVGFNAKLFKQLTMEAQISINDKFDPVYRGLYDAFIQWENSDKTHAINVGRLDYVYTGMERSTSSKKIKNMERALIVNMVMPGEVVGIYAKGKLPTHRIRPVGSAAASRMSLPVSREVSLLFWGLAMRCRFYTTKAHSIWIISITTAMKTTTPLNHTCMSFHSGMRGRKACWVWALI